MSERVPLPSLAGASAWVNTEPLTPADLRHHVVLVNFWTLTCINWLRQEPWVRAWARAYRDDGLVVLGVHTPEFSFEHEIDGVRRAVAERGIDYPVAVDNDYAVWKAFGNRYWPALYFAGRDGVIHDEHFGEGRYEQSERVLQRLLHVNRPPVAPGVQGAGVEAAADWRQLKTPETYLGYARGERFASPEDAGPEPAVYRLPTVLGGNHWALSGEWTFGPERVALVRPGGGIAFRFSARDAHAVLAGTGEPIGFRVTIDGAPPGPAAGADVDADGSGVLREGRLYQLTRSAGKVRERTLEITFEAAGAEAYAFTFG
ncbi:redoxin domain-containing protein [Cryptosporangium phraense]|uniref:Redoxin domain-containing protein n=1 Tax=Cryptosporangium phraense TaxID=2593070 RepID=A0A545AQD5_9ACTN|nr:redoxin domain-containing protein [Cryptosporangium phraense]TQS42945.1 redoxin domain-containing protein [Cryptosporangium phraense]